MYGLTRATTTLLAAGIAGALIWFASWIGPDDSNGEYWAAMGLLAAGGLVLALSQVVGGWTKWGRPTISWPVLGLAFVPTLIAAGWVLVAAQPNANGPRDATQDWLAEIGLFDDFLEVLMGLAPVLALGLGLVFGFVFDTTGRRRRDELVHEERHSADEPVAAEREHDRTRPVAHEHEHEHDRERERETAAVGSRDAPARAEHETVERHPDDGRSRRRLFRR